MNKKADNSELITLIKNFLDNYSNPQEIFTEEEAAKHLRVPLQTLKNYAKKRKITWSLVGKQKIYTRENLHEFIDRKSRLHKDW